MCGYHTLLEIASERIPDNICEKFIIYRIHQDHLDDAALRWWHYPSSNLLANMTLEEENFYEILAIPKTRGKCPLLGETGCEYPRAKPFNCEIFPFHYEKGIFQAAAWCKYIEALEVRSFDSKVHGLIQEYQTLSSTHNKEYFDTLGALKKKYNWRIHHFRIF